MVVQNLAAFASRIAAVAGRNWAAGVNGAAAAVSVQDGLVGGRYSRRYSSSSSTLARRGYSMAPVDTTTTAARQWAIVDSTLREGEQFSR